MSDLSRRDFWPLKLTGAIIVGLAIGLLVVRDINFSLPIRTASFYVTMIAAVEAGVIAGLVMVLRRRSQVAGTAFADVDLLLDQYSREEAARSTNGAPASPSH